MASCLDVEFFTILTPLIVMTVLLECILCSLPAVVKLHRKSRLLLSGPISS